MSVRRDIAAGWVFKEAWVTGRVVDVVEPPVPIVSMKIRAILVLDEGATPEIITITMHTTEAARLAASLLSSVIEADPDCLERIIE